MNVMASQITGVPMVYSNVCSSGDKKKTKLRVAGLCEMNSLVTSEFSAQRASNAVNVSIWWRHYDSLESLSERVHETWLLIRGLAWGLKFTLHIVIDKSIFSI